MDWASIINDLTEAGVTQKEIGREVGLRQSSVSDLARGIVTDVRWGVGDRLIALHAKKCKRSSRASAELT